MKPLFSLVLMLGLASLSPCLFAQEPIHESIEVEGTLSTREPGSKNLIVLDRQAIEQLMVSDMASLFARLPGLTIQRRGPGDGSFDLTMRGGHFEQVLLLVNGRPFSSAQTGHFTTDFPFSFQDIERIEIVRGGTSTASGAGAFAGLVNLVVAPPRAPRLEARLGERKTASLYAGASHSLGPWTLGGSIQRETTSGFFPGRELAQTRSLLLAAWERPALRAELQAGWLQKAFGAAGFYAPLPSREEIEALLVTTRVSGHSGSFRYQASQSYNRHHDTFVLDRTRPALYSGVHLTERWEGALSAGGTVAGIALDGGLDHSWERMDSSTMKQHQRTRLAGYANLARLFRWGGLDGGIRLESVDQGAPQLTFQAGGFTRLSPLVHLRINGGRSLRLPSFTERFYVDPANQGDPDLSPEHSDHLEMVLSGIAPRLGVDVSVFYRRQENTIDWFRTSPTARWQALNLRQHDMAGIEGSLRIGVGRGELQAGCERLFALNRPPAMQSKYGLRFPDLRVTAAADQPLGRRLRVHAAYTFKRLYQTGEQGHFLDLALQFIAGPIRLALRGENLLGQRFEEIPGVPVAGRFLSLVLNVDAALPGKKSFRSD